VLLTRALRFLVKMDSVEPGKWAASGFKCWSWTVHGSGAGTMLVPGGVHLRNGWVQEQEGQKWSQE
jgi:hypothetical protein